MYMKEIVKELEIHSGTELKIDEEGRCNLKLDSKYIVTLEESKNSDNFYLYSILGKLDSNNQKNHILLKLMEANLFGIQSNNATFSFDSQEKTIVLHRYFIPDKIDYQDFERDFLEFFSTVKDWEEKLTMLMQEIPLEQKMSHLNNNSINKKENVKIIFG